MTTRKYITSSVEVCEEGNELGAGAFGTVRECKRNAGKKAKFVMKRSKPYKDMGDDEEKIDEMDGEYDFIAYQPPSGIDKYAVVAKMYPVMKDDSCFDKTAVVMEKMDSDLYKVYDTYKTSTDSMFQIIQKLFYMLNYFHDKVGYCHNDIKPGNIGYTKEGEVKLIDMGSAVPIKPNEKPYHMHDNKRLHGGTLMYMTKNTFIDEMQDSKNRDRWAMGCTIYELVAGTPMNHPLNSDIEFSYFKIIENYNKALLDYMLGNSEELSGIPYISKGMIEARGKFLENLKKFAVKSETIHVDRPKKIKEIICNYMTPSLVETKPDKPQTLATGGGNDACTDPTPENGVITKRGDDGRLEIIKIVNLEKYRLYLQSIKHSCMSGGGRPIRALQVRKKITEKQYNKAKAMVHKKVRVAKYRLKDGSYVYYKYS